MKKLSESQQQIIDQLVKEFEKINIKPISTGGLINIGQVKENVRAKEVFIKECKLEQDTFKRIVSKQVVADAEKLRADLNELGLDVNYRNDGFCISSFDIIKLGDPLKTSLEYINYDTLTHVIKEKFGAEFHIPLTYKVGHKFGYSYHGIEYFHTIEALVHSVGFRTKLERYYESLNKTI